MSSSPSSSSSSSEASSGPADEYASLYGVMCDVSVLLGTGQMSVRQCLYLTPDTVVPLVQPAGADLQVLVNGVAVATGEVVIVDDSTAVRLTQVLAPPHDEGRA